MIDLTAQDPGVVVFEAPSCELRDLGGGIACFVLRGKLNLLNWAVIDDLVKTIDLVRSGFAGLLVAGAGERAFSVGADLSFFSTRIAEKDWAGVERFVRAGQEAYRALRFAPFPSVAAAFGLALGGGCELMLHCTRIVAAPGLRAGLPEPLVGLIPAWGGCTQLLRRTGDPVRVLATIASGRILDSAVDAQAAGLLTVKDIVVDPEHDLLSRARQELNELIDSGYTPAPEALLNQGHADELQLLGRPLPNDGADYDRHLASELAYVLSAGEGERATVTEREMMERELQVICRLVKEPRTMARIEAMLKTGKPLRN